MTIEQLRHVHNARPFQPFVLRTADGREYTIEHPELMSFSRTGRTVAVATTDDAHDIIDLLLVASVHVGNGRKKVGPGGRPRK